MIFLSELLKQTLDINIGSTFEKIQNRVTDTIGHYWISPYKHWGKCTRKVNGHGFRVAWKNWGTYLWLFICCKTKLKKNFFFKFICFLQNIHYLQKRYFYMEKKFYNEKFFYWKKLFYTEKYKWKCKNLYLILKKYFYTENVCVTNKI